MSGSNIKVNVVVNGCFGGYGFNELGEAIFADLGFQDPMTLSRHHPVLVKVVEEIGNEISGMGSDLYVETIKGHEYRINEYDGSETVVVPGQSNYINVDSSEVRLTKEKIEAINRVVDTNRPDNENSDYYYD